MSHFTEHIGKRLKLYRKAKHLTQAEFAKMVHKSKSAISKYEHGEISMDIDTLQEMADALHIDLRQLLDYPKEHNETTSIQGFFGASSRFYTYYLNKSSTRIVRGVLEIAAQENGEYTSTLYTGLDDYENLYRCSHLYAGDIYYSDSYITMVMVNQSNNAERVFLVLSNPYNHTATMTSGMLCGISDKYLIPIALKVILSKYPLPEEEPLRELLRFSKEDYNSVKRTFCFSIDRFVE